VNLGWLRHWVQVSLTFRGKQNWRETSFIHLFTMDAIKYGNLLGYVKNKVYPSNFTKQEKAILRRFAKKFEVAANSNLRYLDKTKEGTLKRRLVIREDERQKVFKECHSGPSLWKG
jgi:hypothetical protein